MIGSVDTRQPPTGPSAPSGDGRTRVLVTNAGGGFAAQSVRLMELLKDRYELHCVVTREFPDSMPNVRHASQVWRLTSPGLNSHGHIDQLRQTVKALWQSLWIILRSNPSVVIGIGTSLSLPLCLWGRLFGKKIVFIEDITRPFELSTTGRLLLALRATHRFYVQWPEQVTRKDIIYAGRLL